MYTYSFIHSQPFFLSLRKQTSHSFIHLFIQRIWLLVPYSPGADLSLGDSRQLCSSIMLCIPPDLPWFPCMPALWAGKPASIHPDSRPSIHPFIRLNDWLLVPHGPEQGLSLGDSSRLCSSSHNTSHSPDLPRAPFKTQGTGRRTGISTRSFSCLFWDIIALLHPHLHHLHILVFLGGISLSMHLLMAFYISDVHLFFSNQVQSDTDYLH